MDTDALLGVSQYLTIKEKRKSRQDNKNLSKSRVSERMNGWATMKVAGPKIAYPQLSYIRY
jgi:hypothetical protein